jgi:hypothetical protein
MLEYSIQDLTFKSQDDGVGILATEESIDGNFFVSMVILATWDMWSISMEELGERGLLPVFLLFF